MTDACSRHRPYLAALADGEVELVPAATREHVQTCRDCGRELEAHRLLGQRLRAGARAEQPAAAAFTPAGRRRAFLPLAAVAAVLAVVIGVQLVIRSGPDPLAAAVTVADRQPEYWSSDPVQLAAWCSKTYGNRVPAVAVNGLTPVGARMDWPDGIGVATVSYRLDGMPVHISWLSSSAGGPVPTAVTVNGRQAVVVRAHGITALVTGDASERQLQDVARQVASAE